MSRILINTAQDVSRIFGDSAQVEWSERYDFVPDQALGMLCITLARLWRAKRDEPQGVFLHPIAQLLERITTQRTARVTLISTHKMGVNSAVELANLMRNAAK